MSMIRVEDLTFSYPSGSENIFGSSDLSEGTAGEKRRF